MNVERLSRKNFHDTASCGRTMRAYWHGFWFDGENFMQRGRNQGSVLRVRFHYDLPGYSNCVVGGVILYGFPTSVVWFA